ncbi:MAG TPA: hypothetical protein PKI68_00515 [Pontiellaceae bacterium]|nr:hypothetical protein [Pontiellaceae bacterium]
MKKVLLFSMIAIVGLTVSAAETTKADYIAKAKAAAEKKGRAFDEAKTAKAFDKLDTNKDGVLSAEEQAAPKAK